MSRGEPAAAGLGILGGTFNPPHVGHLALARHAFGELGLGRILLMPSHTPPHKPLPDCDPGPEHRLAMCHLAAAGSEWLCASELEVRRGGPSYTVDTLRDIHASDPEAHLTLLLGADMALTLPTWREPQDLLELADIAIAKRDDTKPEQILDALAGLCPTPGSVRFLEMGPVDASSSEIRARLVAGEALEGGVPHGQRPLRELLAPGVSDYICEHGLYRGPAGGLST